jgi:hypothetical protein
VLVTTSLGGPGQKVGPVDVGPPSAQAAALSFTRDSGYLDVIVRDPVAGPARYRAEFAAHHLRITLQLVPVSPSLVGTVVYMGISGPGTITTITRRDPGELDRHRRRPAGPRSGAAVGQPAG